MSLDKQFLKLVREQLSTIDKQMTDLSAQRAQLVGLLGEDPAKVKAKAKAAKPAITEAAPAENTAQPAAPAAPRQRKGYIGHLMPFMLNRQEVAAAAMHDHLKSVTGQADLKRNAVDAAIQNELKKGDKARLGRVRPGVYAITQAGIDSLNAEEGIGTHNPEVQEAAQQPAEVEGTGESTELAGAGITRY